MIVCPIGFISDHLEVVWDLDNEGLDKAQELGLGYRPRGDGRDRSAIHRDGP